MQSNIYADFYSVTRESLSLSGFIQVQRDSYVHFDSRAIWVEV